MPRRDPLLGYLRGTYPNGSPAVISVYKAGRGYRLSGERADHLCHPSVGSIETVKREAFHVYGIDAEFEPR
jgi:hypothetical protein